MAEIDPQGKVDLPSKQQLEELLAAKGRDALTCYAWRNAMRALAVLGRYKVKKAWPKEAIGHLFAVIRGDFLVFLRVDDFDPDVVSAAALDVAVTLEAATVAILDAAAATIFKGVASATAASAFYNTASAAAKAAKAADAANAYDVNIRAAAKALAYNDYKLLSETNTFSQNWLAQPLWYYNKPALITKWEASLCDQLNLLGLDFVAEDLQSLWHGKPPSQYIKNYAKAISHEELKTVAGIRRLVLDEESISQNYAVRAILIGPGGAGKTSLFHLLNDGNLKAAFFDLAVLTGFKPSKPPTVGVEYKNHQPVNLKKYQSLIDSVFIKEKAKNLALYLWDFGGQAIFHSLHSAFLHENCVYILVVDSRHEQAPELWLEQIKAVTQNQGKVILVTNCFDGIKGSQNQTALLRKYPQLLDKNSFFDFCCINRKSQGFARFYNRLISLSVASQRQLFENTAKAMEVVKDYYQHQNFIDILTLKKLLKDTLPGVDDQRIKELIDSLAAFGRCVAVDDNNADMCLKPEWVVGKAYAVINAPLTTNNNGIVSYQEIASILAWSEPDTAKLKVLTDRVIGFLLKQKVCIQLKSKQYFLPDAAAMQEPETCIEILRQPQQVLAYELTYLPIDTKTRIAYELIGHNNIELGQRLTVWRDGLLLASPDGKNHLLLEYQSRRQRIEIILAGQDEKLQVALLSEIRAALELVLGKSVLGPLYLEDFFSRYQAGERPPNLAAKNKTIKTALKREAVKYIDKTRIININNSHVEGSLIGKGMNKPRITTNNYLSPDDKTLMLKTLDQLLASDEYSFNKTQLSSLTRALVAVENAENQVPEVADEKSNGIVQKLWDLMKNIDAAASMSERICKYGPLLGPLIMSL